MEKALPKPLLSQIGLDECLKRLPVPYQHSLFARYVAHGDHRHQADELFLTATLRRNTYTNLVSMRVKWTFSIFSQDSKVKKVSCQKTIQLHNVLWA
jgi:hypothetical protein